MNTDDLLAVEYLAERWASMLYIGSHSEGRVLLEAAEYTRLGGGGRVAARAIARVMRDCRREETDQEAYIVDRRDRRLEGALNLRRQLILDAAAATAQRIQSRDQRAALEQRIVDVYDPSVSIGIDTYDAAEARP